MCSIGADGLRQRRNVEISSYWEFMINHIMHGCLLMMMNGHDSGDHLDQTAVMMCVCMASRKEGQHDVEVDHTEAMRSKVEQIAHATLSQLGHIPGRSPFSIANQNSGVLKVIRMSTTSKIIGNIILSGSLKAIRVHIQDTIGTARPKPAEGSKNSFAHCDHQPADYSSISVFTDLVEAVEIAWAVAAGHSHLLKEKTPAAMSAASSSPQSLEVEQAGYYYFHGSTEFCFRS
ncbi:hypothetical protein FNV43_RR18456 [Rhamnella rubrinervis]|uniref:Uncharacterized protein n=1 Tax=Rhamnella rubrinervis TaxID=2594499 RepID=A0A8K0DZ19_9ROSA|nr:hypothetical protein FNV43_RR18456 [Rhamnella rubrinervis]